MSLVEHGDHTSRLLFDMVIGKVAALWRDWPWFGYTTARWAQPDVVFVASECQWVHYSIARHNTQLTRFYGATVRPRDCAV